MEAGGFILKVCRRRVKCEHRTSCEVSCDGGDSTVMLRKGGYSVKNESESL